MATLKYSPKGTHGYLCELVSADGLVVQLANDANGVVVDGDAAATTNSTLVGSLSAFGSNEHAFRRSRNKERRELFAKIAREQAKLASSLIDLIDALGDEMTEAYCSACLELAVHRQVARRMTPTLYLCGQCGAPTTVCAVPGCTQMAQRNTTRVRIGSFCAEHRHEIPSFERADKTLATLDDFDAWLTFDSRNAKRFTSLAMGTFGGAAVIGPAAFWAAPAIGGAIGAASGLSGAAATSHGLAVLGGGAVASGGLGMAGGAAVVAAVGTGLGSAMGARVTAAYVNSDESFAIERLSDGTGAPVVFASGFLTENDDGWGGWEPIIRTRYPDRPVLRLRWGAKELADLAALLGLVVAGRGGVRTVAKAAARAAKNTAGRMVVLRGLLDAYALAKNPWSVARTRADMTGAALADLIARTNETGYVLIGHSLGARVMAKAALALGTDTRGPRLEAVHLLGAAISSRTDLQPLNDAVSGHVINYWSSNDRVLRQIYRGAELGERAAGAHGFGQRLPPVKNRNVSRSVPDHSAYLDGVSLG